MCLYCNLTLTVIPQKHRARKQSVFLLKLKKHHKQSKPKKFKRSPPWGSHCKGDRAGEQLCKGGEQRAAGLPEIQPNNPVHAYFVLSINEQKVVCDRIEGKPPLGGLRSSVSYSFNYISALVNNLQRLVRNRH